MKRITRRQRERDVIDGLSHRTGKRHLSDSRSRSRSNSKESNSWVQRNKWIDERRNIDLNVSINNKRQVTIILPEKMNFSTQYEEIIVHISAIRKLTEVNQISNKAYRLVNVNFDNLMAISTSAALVLTAELSKWDDVIRQKLRPLVDNWNPRILRQFHDLGFFELFTNKQVINLEEQDPLSPELKLMKYIKGRRGESAKSRGLKAELTKIIGEEIEQWGFLRGGLDEAVTNVTHHAYPADCGFMDYDKNWYLTGSYNQQTNTIKIVFYDQGIGIPKSLPASDIWEKILQSLSRFSVVERKRDEVLLRAAVELDRTRTSQTGRGKGLQDLLEFIRQRGNGYLSILSLKGLYKYSNTNREEKIKSVHFDKAICGTLIIWSATLSK